MGVYMCVWEGGGLVCVYVCVHVRVFKGLKLHSRKGIWSLCACDTGLALYV